jgi:micrococcal nuclease
MGAEISGLFIQNFSMLAYLSPFWLILLGMLLCAVLFFIFRKINLFLTQLFKPFKKGKKYWCKVIAVSDGDTITCTRYNLRRSETKLRFAYVDAPESTQTYGKESQHLVKKMVYYKLVHVEITDVDRYGRCVGVIYRFRRNINQELVKRGAAWVYEEYIKNPTQKQKWLALQNQAKKQKKGLWKNSHPVRPSVYRKQNK